MLISFFLFSGFSTFAQKYVSLSGDDAWNGDAVHIPFTQIGPYRTIQYGIDNPDITLIIYVYNDPTTSTPPDYDEHITWPSMDNLQLIGINNALGEPPIIDGNGTDRVITMDNISNNPLYIITNNTIIDNFEIINGRANGGLYSPPGPGNGGGIYIAGWTAPIIQNLIVRNCSANLDGGGIFCYVENEIINNSCQYWKTRGTIQINHCKVNSNRAASGGGLFFMSSYNDLQTNDCPQIDVDNPTVIINSSTFEKNNATAVGGGIYGWWAYGVFNESEITANTCTNQYGVGGLELYRCRSEMHGILVHNNKPGGINLYHGLKHRAACSLCGSFQGIEHLWYNVDIIGNLGNNTTGSSGTNGVGLSITNSNLLTPVDPSDYLDLVYEGGHINYNEGGYMGGGIYVESRAKLCLKDIEIRKNSAHIGGGIYNNCQLDPFLGTPTTLVHNFEQLLITDNETIYNNYPNLPSGAGTGAGIFTHQSFYCINSTIAYNKSNSSNVSDCPGITIQQPNPPLPSVISPIFYNSIIWGNRSNVAVPYDKIQVGYSPFDCNPQLNYCDIEEFPSGIWNYYNTWIPSLWNSPPGTAPVIISSDPNFIDPATFDYSLPNTVLFNPCRNAGNNLLMIPDIDLNFSSYNGFPWGSDFEGNARINGGNTIDIGAYESAIAKNSGDIQEFGRSNIDDSAMAIKPNPVHFGQDLNIELISQFNDEVIITISDVSGRQNYESKFYLQNTLNISINTQEIDLRPGLYFLNIMHSDKSKQSKNTCKIIVTH